MKVGWLKLCKSSPRQRRELKNTFCACYGKSFEALRLACGARPDQHTNSGKLWDLPVRQCDFPWDLVWASLVFQSLQESLKAAFTAGNSSGPSTKRVLKLSTLLAELGTSALAVLGMLPPSPISHGVAPRVWLCVIFVYTCVTLRTEPLCKIRDFCSQDNDQHHSVIAELLIFQMNMRKSYPDQPLMVTCNCYTSQHTIKELFA